MRIDRKGWREQFSRVQTILLLLAAGALTSLTGCATALPTCEPPPPPPPKIEPTYVRVDYEAQRTVEVSEPAEVSETPVYRRDRPSWRTVALRVPNSCLNESAARATGESVHSRSILTTTCAVWLKELERALVEAHYRVISWDALHRAESAGDMSTYRIASDLGADVVFIINSLESNTKNMTDEAKVSHSYFASNERGVALEPKPLRNEERTWLREFVKSRTNAAFRNAEGLKAQAATLDVTAIVAETGESVWFYRRSLTRAADSHLQATDRMSFLFAHWNEHWWPVQPAGLAKPIPAAVTQETMSARDVETDRAVGGPEDAIKALELELVRTIVGDFVDNFKGDAALRGSTPTPQGREKSQQQPNAAEGNR